MDSSVEMRIICFVMGLSVALISLLGVFVYRKQKDATSRAFLMYTLSLALWITLKIISLRLNSLEWTFALFGMLYFSAFLTAVFFVRFVHKYVNKNKKDNFKLNYLLLLLTLVILIISLVPGLFLKSIVFTSDTFPKIEYSIIGASIFVLSFLFTISYGIYLLIKSYKNETSKNKKHKILYLLFAVSLPPVLSFVLSLVLPIFGGVYRLSWISNISVAISVSLMAYAMTKYKIFNVRMVLTEFFIVVLLVISLAQLFSSKDASQFYLNILYVVITLGFGFLLLRSTRSEIQKAQKLEQLTKQLQQANKQLSRLDKAKTEFLSLATHQLRTPVASILGYSSMMLEGDYGHLPAKIKPVIEHIKTSAQFMAEIISDFLDVSRIELNKLNLSYTSININEFLHNTVEHFKLEAKNKNIKLDLKLPQSKCAPIIQADPKYLQLVFLNLVENAIEYTPPNGQVKITISLNKQDNTALIRVQDTGIGISKKELPKIFGKFTRASNAKKYNNQGSGLGLYVVQKIVQKHGGKIWATSKGVGKGAVFFVELPIKQVKCD